MKIHRDVLRVSDRLLAVFSFIGMRPKRVLAQRTRTKAQYPITSYLPSTVLKQSSAASILLSKLGFRLLHFLDALVLPISKALIL